MKLEIDITGEQLEAMVVGSLKSYHTYLRTSTWAIDDHERIMLIQAFGVVLGEYLTEEQWGEYNQDFN